MTFEMLYYSLQNEFDSTLTIEDEVAILEKQKKAFRFCALCIKFNHNGGGGLNQISIQTGFQGRPK